MPDSNDRSLESPVFSRCAAPADLKQQARDWDWEVWESADPTFAHHDAKAVRLFVGLGTARISFRTGNVVDLQAGDLLTIHGGAMSV